MVPGTTAETGNDTGGPSKAMIEGRQRGVIFDVGHGGGSFAWRVAAPLMKAGFTPDSRTFFHRVRQLTLEGMFGDPSYGGNRGFAGWDLIRYPGPRMAVAPDEQKLREPIKPLRASAT